MRRGRRMSDLNEPSPPPLPPHNPSRAVPYASVPPLSAAPTKRGIGCMVGGIVCVVVVLFLFVVLQSKPSVPRGPEIPLSVFRTELQNDNIAEIVIDGDLLRGRFVKPAQVGTPAATATTFRVELPSGTSQNWNFVSWLLASGSTATIRVENNQNLLINLLLPLVPWLMIFVFIWFFVFRQLRKHPVGKPMPVYIVPPENK
jgi:ATP-dependent Zn protease